MLKDNIRTVNVDGETYFMGKDIDIALNANVQRQIHRLPKKYIIHHRIATNGGSQTHLFLSIDGVQYLLSRSRNPLASDLAREFHMKIISQKYESYESSTIGAIMKK